MLTATLCIDGIATPSVRLHTTDSRGEPCAFVFVDLGQLSLHGDDPEDFRRVAAALLEAAEKLTTAINGPAPAAPAPEVAAS